MKRLDFFLDHFGLCKYWHSSQCSSLPPSNNLLDGFRNQVLLIHAGWDDVAICWNVMQLEETGSFRVYNLSVHSKTGLCLPKDVGADAGKPIAYGGWRYDLLMDKILHYS